MHDSSPPSVPRSAADGGAAEYTDWFALETGPRPPVANLDMNGRACVMRRAGT